MSFKRSVTNVKDVCDIYCLVYTSWHTPLFVVSVLPIFARHCIRELLFLRQLGFGSSASSSYSNFTWPFIQTISL